MEALKGFSLNYSVRLAKQGGTDVVAGGGGERQRMKNGNNERS